MIVIYQSASIVEETRERETVCGHDNHIWRRPYGNMGTQNGKYRRKSAESKMIRRHHQLVQKTGDGALWKCKRLVGWSIPCS